MVYLPPGATTSFLKLLIAVSCWASFLPNRAAYAKDPFADFPVVISCEVKGTYHAFYLSRVTKDGTATYTASDRIAGTITLDGKAKAIGGLEGGTCGGKTLDELRASGQAHDLKS
ncbi:MULTISPECIES: hypothetical protein [unclassified Rhizobium]|uniref:hypothetical protein n=1 Tax=unclassified Rhizobium TaxID=2613769 RepID=UPI00161AB382|nr:MULTISPECIES: hypothetical protein [unclassified Rhizobium]MBB3315679.1 hypothetical protein [Rhizobium sp. BK181]MCS3743801.1 hypothetical protein [Rhizobium sp. BK661]MCS4096124.1 hypothetical protein [Rhizobium sp. BK176]